MRTATAAALDTSVQAPTPWQLGHDPRRLDLGALVEDLRSVALDHDHEELALNVLYIETDRYGMRWRCALSSVAIIAKLLGGVSGALCEEDHLERVQERTPRARDLAELAVRLLHLLESSPRG